MRDWGGLERGILLEIFLRVRTDIDALHFLHVCRRWRAAAGDGRAPVPRPWFIFLLPDGAPAPHRHAYLRLRGRRRRRLRRTRAKPVRVDAIAKGSAPDSRVTGASRGWLVVSAGGRVVLRDPASGADVPLPAFDVAHRLVDAFLSDDPLRAPGRWTAFAFFARKEIADPEVGHVLAFCRAGGAEWTRLDQPSHSLPYRSLEFFHGRAYVLLGNGNVAVCDLDARRVVTSPVTFYDDYAPGFLAQWRIVECGGELLCVEVARGLPIRRRMACLFGGGGYGRHRYAARAFSIQLAADGGGMPVAASEVDAIGDHALFVAPHGHAFALPASGFPAIKSGCVYHIAYKWYTKIATDVVITQLLEAGAPWRRTRGTEMRLAERWTPLSWFCPRGPMLETKPARR
ncbi:hypothetical protein ACP4OV_004104 [Aristida adscensionis]